MQNKIFKSIDEALECLSYLKSQNGIDFISNAAHMIADCFQQGGKIIIAGNGGSLCDANHFAEELTGLFRSKRKALPAIALSESGHLTCVGNDLGFDFVFSRGVEAFGKPGDIFIGLTTSGNSSNIVKAIEVAKDYGLRTISFLGKNGGKLKGVADLELIVKGFGFSDRIQEVHMTAIHIIIEMVEEILFNSSKKEAFEDDEMICRI